MNELLKVINRVLEDGFRTSLNPDDLCVAWNFVEFEGEIKELMMHYNRDYSKATKNVSKFLKNFLNS